MNIVSNNVGGENMWMQRKNIKRNAFFHGHNDLILEPITPEDESEIRSEKMKHFLLKTQIRNAKDIVSNLYFL